MLFSLTLTNYVDRATLSFAIEPVSHTLGLSTVAKGFLAQGLRDLRGDGCQAS